MYCLSELTPLLFLFLRVSLESRALGDLLVSVDPLDLLDLLDCPVLPERLVVRYDDLTSVLDMYSEQAFSLYDFSLAL